MTEMRVRVIVPIFLVLSVPLTAFAQANPKANSNTESVTSELDTEAYSWKGPIAEPFKQWNQLVESGCKANGYNPMLLRMLRNVPFAMRGHRFKSPELATLFSLVPPWKGKKPTKGLSEAEKACVSRLKELEAQKRKTWDLCPPRLEKMLIQHPAMFGFNVADTDGAFCRQNDSGQINYGIERCSMEEEAWQSCRPAREGEAHVDGQVCVDHEGTELCSERGIFCSEHVMEGCRPYFAG